MKPKLSTLALLVFGCSDEHHQPATMTLVPLRDVTQVSTGTDHQCALRSSGDVLCWGGNTVGELGLPSSDDRWLWATPVPGVADVARVSSGGNHSCAVTKDGKLWCWGSANGLAAELIQQGMPGQSPFLVELDRPAMDVAAGAQHTCVLLADRSVQCWGSDESGQAGAANRVTCMDPNNSSKLCVQRPSEVIATGVSSLSAGTLHTCAVAGGSVQCWGDEFLSGVDGANLLPDPCLAMSEACNALPLPVPIVHGVEHLASGQRHACATGSAGTYCWGHNELARTGDTQDSGSEPHHIDLAGVDIAVTLDYSCAVRGDGRIACWGTILRAAPISSDSPLLLEGTGDVIALSGGRSSMCALRSDGTVVSIGPIVQGDTLRADVVNTLVPDARDD